MKLIRCRKCGAVITTNDTIMQNYMDEIERLSKLAIRDRKNASVYLNKAASLRKISTQIIHLTAQRDEDMRRLTNELGELVSYIRENGLISDDKLYELQEIARKRARQKNAEDEKRVEALYGNFNSILGNSSRRDPTEKVVMKKMGKERIRNEKGAE